jgi:hypothetical protein
MFKWTTLVLTGLACCLTLPAVDAGTDMGCLPPPLTQDYLKKTVRVEIKGQLVRVRRENDGSDPRDIRFITVWQVSANGKTYTLDFGRTHLYATDRLHTLIALPPWMELPGKAEKLAGKTVIVTGTLDGTTVHVTDLKADDEFVKETTEVEARGQLSALYLELIRPLIPEQRLTERPESFPPQLVAWNFVVDGQTYTLTFATPELESLAKKLDGKAVVLTGELKNNVITVKTLKAAE